MGVDATDMPNGPLNVEAVFEMVDFLGCRLGE